MLKNAPLVLLTAGVLTLALLNLGNAQPPASPPSPAPQAYKPGLGDLMTTTVKPRHTKLGIAGQEKNWAYAAYELHELQELFDPSGTCLAGLSKNEHRRDALGHHERTHGKRGGRD